MILVAAVAPGGSLQVLLRLPPVQHTQSLLDLAAMVGLLATLEPLAMIRLLSV
jgi:hypothetical protein